MKSPAFMARISGGKLNIKEFMLIEAISLSFYAYSMTGFTTA
jgi:hypothetical protein